MLEIGSVIDGKYKILDEIGKGGMSVVYQAKNERANKSWAIKEIRKDGVQDYEVVRQNLIAETDMLKKLNHPNLPSIVDVIDRDGTFLIVMDYIEGRPLSDILKASGAQPQEDVIEWAKQLCDVLGYLHSRKPAIIYRDMKPSNVMLKPDGNVMLIDFGTAREFKSTSVEDTKCLGTIGYAAPEQFGGHGQTDARTDIYCLGATMYHLVTGHNPAIPPYEMYPIRQWNPALSSGLEEIILKCTQKNPNQRYQNCAELLYALDNVDKLDIEYKREQNLKWKIFCTSSIATVVMALGALGFSLGSSAMISNTYQGYINKANAATSVSERVAYCKQAIKVDPKKVDAFETLLDTYCSSKASLSIPYSEADDRLSFGKEFAEFKEITSQYLESGDEEYNTAEFADRIYLRVGQELFYLCDNTIQGRNSAIVWLDRAEKYCSSDNKELAKLISSTAKYYKKMSNEQRDEYGNTVEVSYSEYWKNLCDMERYVSDKNISLTLEVCRLCLSEIQNRAVSFKASGVTKELMESFIDELSQDVLMVEKSSRISLNDTTSLREAKEALKNVKEVIERVYGVE